jgi:Caspase domain
MAPRSRRQTIAVILGGSTFPGYPALDSSPALAKSAEDFRNYLMSGDGLGIPTDNLKFLFDKDEQPGPLIECIREFIKERKQNIPDLSDLIFYYCGHGSYLHEREYFLALRCTNAFSKEATVFKIAYLVDIIADLTRNLRNLIVLDACYSGGALGEFRHLSEHNAANLVTEQLYNGLAGTEEGPSSVNESEAGGTILFCAAGPKKWAKTPLEAQRTMFSGALLNVLETGDPKAGRYLTPKNTAMLVQREIQNAFGSQGVRPQIHVPIQGNSDPLLTPYFPNPAFNPEDFEERLKNLEESIRETKQTMADLNLAVREVRSRPSIDPEQIRSVEQMSSNWLATPEGQTYIRTILALMFIDILTVGVIAGVLKIASRYDPTKAHYDYLPIVDKVLLYAGGPIC